MSAPVIGHRQELFAQLLNARYFGFYETRGHFHTSGPEPIDRLSVTVIAEAEATPEDYWAWWNISDYGRPDQISFVWCSRGQVDMCFPYGAESETKRGRGEIIRVRVEKLPD